MSKWMMVYPYHEAKVCVPVNFYVLTLGRGPGNMWKTKCKYDLRLKTKIALCVCVYL